MLLLLLLFSIPAVAACDSQFLQWLHLMEEPNSSINLNLQIAHHQDADPVALNFQLVLVNLQIHNPHPNAFSPCIPHQLQSYYPNPNSLLPH